MKEIATISNENRKNVESVIYDFETNILSQHDKNFKKSMPLVEYEKVKATTIATAKEKNWNLVFKTI